MKIAVISLFFFFCPVWAAVSSTNVKASATADSTLVSNLDPKDEEFISSLKKEDSEYVTVEEGIYMKITEKGPEDGRQPTLKDDIKSHFVGKFPNGTVFDSSHERGSMMQVPVSHTLRGWQKALPLMKQGDAAEVCMTPKWAFGSAGAPPHVLPNQVVCYNIHLEQVLDGDQHHYVHPKYAKYAEQYQEMLERQGNKRGAAAASVGSEL